MLKDRSWALIMATLALLVLLTISGLHPYDRKTWVLEVFPVIIALPMLVATYRHYPLTTLLYAFIFFHAVVLMVGGAYTYARVPLGFHMAKWLHLSRNPYDKIGHFFQGFVPALVAREVLIRGSYLRGRKMLVFIVICIVLAISATYELLEWVTALIMGGSADDFLGSQGDPWDTQSDMFFALLGAVAALVGLSRLQDRQIQSLTRKAAQP